MNLYLKEEFQIFWEIIFSMEEVVIREVVDCARETVENKRKTKKR